jgi:hypothetical protein
MESWTRAPPGCTALAHEQEVRHMSGARSKLVLAGTIAVLAFGSFGAAGVAQARHGADDPAGHNAGDDRGGSGGHGADDKPGGVRARAARHGRDDRGGDDNRRHRARAARHGRDDGPRHDAGDDHGGR